MILAKKIARRLREFFPLPRTPVLKRINGIQYVLDLTEEIERALYFGLYEPEVATLLQRYIKPDMVVFEVGANIGAHTFSIARMLRSGKLFSFEPTAYAFERLKKNFGLNDFRNIVIEKLALSDVAENRMILPASSPETMSFKASWDVSGKTKNRREEMILFETLDHYVQKQHLQRVDFIKIDTDGYELKVLKGGRDTIKRFKPILLIETGYLSERMGDSLDAFLQLMRDFRYAIYSKYNLSRISEKELMRVCKERRADDFLFMSI